MEVIEENEFSNNNFEYYYENEEVSLINSVSEILKSIPNNFLVHNLNDLFNKQFNDINTNNIYPNNKNNINKKNNYNKNDDDINLDISFNLKYEEEKYDNNLNRPELTNNKNKKYNIISQEPTNSGNNETKFNNKRKKVGEKQKEETACCFII